MLKHITDDEQVLEFQVLGPYVNGEKKFAQSKILGDAFTWFEMHEY
jgi:hypothetical protein